MGAVIGLDLATLCGWSCEVDGKLSSGVWNLKPPPGSCDRTRELVLFRRLEELREVHGTIDLVGYEEVMDHGRGDTKLVECPRCNAEIDVRIRQSNTKAAHVYGALKGMVEFWADLRGLPPPARVHVGTLKKFACGDGRATKEAMTAMAKLRWPEQAVIDDNEADSLHVLDWVLVKMKRRTKAVIDLRNRRNG